MVDGLAHWTGRLPSSWYVSDRRPIGSALAVTKSSPVLVGGVQAPARVGKAGPSSPRRSSCVSRSHGPILQPPPRPVQLLRWLGSDLGGRWAACREPLGHRTPHRDEDHRAARTEEGGAEGFRSAGRVPQTDRTFDAEVVERMGAEFYHQVIYPTIERAFSESKRYEEIRDSIRAGWR